jgi:hypothetical protein
LAAGGGGGCGEGGGGDRRTISSSPSSRLRRWSTAESPLPDPDQFGPTRLGLARPGPAWSIRVRRAQAGPYPDATRALCAGGATARGEGEPRAGPWRRPKRPARAVGPLCGGRRTAAGPRPQCERFAAAGRPGSGWERARPGIPSPPRLLLPPSRRPFTHRAHASPSYPASTRTPPGSPSAALLIAPIDLSRPSCPSPAAALALCSARPLCHSVPHRAPAPSRARFPGLRFSVGLLLRDRSVSGGLGMGPTRIRVRILPGRRAGPVSGARYANALPFPDPRPSPCTVVSLARA